MHFQPTMRCFVSLLVTVVLSSSLWSAEAPAAGQIESWIKQLGHEDFQKREEARAALLKAGLPAMAALKQAKQSSDNEVRNAASLLVEQLQWQAVPAQIDYLKLFPAETIFAMKIRDLDAFAKSSQKTALLKLLENPDLKPLADLLTARAKKQMGPGLPLLQKWLGHFSGQMAGGVWAMNPMDPNGIRMALVAELKADAVDKVFREFLAETQLLKGAIPTPLNGLTILKGPNEMGAIALAGRHVILGPNLESVRIVAESLLEVPANALGTKPSFLKALANVGGEPELIFTTDIQQYLGFIGKMAPEGAKTVELLRKLGYDSLDFVLLSTRIIGDRYEDRFAVVLNDKPSPLVDLLNQVYSAQGDVRKAFGPVPANAVVAASGYLDATTMYRFVLDWVKEMAQIAGQAKPGEMDRQIADFEQLTGVKLNDLLGTMKGDMAFWVELAPALAPPHIGFYVECPDESKALELAGFVGKYLEIAGQMAPPPARDDDDLQPVPPPNAEKKADIPPAPNAPPKAEGQDPGQPAKPPAPTFQKVDFKGHTIYTESAESPLVLAKGREVLPYRLTWAKHGKRLFVASSVVQMEKRLAALDAGTPGLDPTRLLAAGGPDVASIKGLFMVDVKRAMDYGAKFGLPLLAAVAGNDKELQAEISRLGELAAEKSLFENVPPLVAFGMPPQDRVQSTILWTPAPYLPTVILGASGAAMFGMQAARRIEPPVAPPAPPPDEKF